MFYQN
jgi:hypothetical protein